MFPEFTITPSCGRPESFNQSSDCPIASESFGELMKLHFKNKITPYLVALIEDSGKYASLYDLKSIRNWFNFKEWKVEDCKNPKTKQVCVKISVLGIDIVGVVTELENWDSLQGFKRSSYKNEDELKIRNEIQPEPVPEPPLQEIDDLRNRLFRLAPYIFLMSHRFSQGFQVDEFQNLLVIDSDVNLAVERLREDVNLDENHDGVPVEILDEQEAEQQKAMEEVD